MVNQNQTSSSFQLRAENVSKIVTGFALQEYVFKQLLVVESSSAWKETYFEEKSEDLTASASRNIKGVGRFSEPPYVETQFTEKSGRHLKYMDQTRISWEDALTNDVDVVRRHLLRLARAISKAVDDTIYSALSDNAGSSTASTGAWDTGTPKIITDIAVAKRKIAVFNYNPDRGGFLLLSPKDFESLYIELVETRGASIPAFSSEAVTNGKVMTINNLTVLVSNSVTADEALVVVSKEVGTWKSVQNLTTETIRDPGIKWTIRSWEIGQVQITNPNAIAKITNTQN